MELAAGIMAAKQAQTAQAMQMKFIKAQFEAQASIVNMIAEVAKSAPPPGQGTKVDITA